MSVEVVGIELELRGADAVERDLAQLENRLNALGGRKQVELGLTKAKEEIIKTRGEIEKIQRDIDKLMNGRKRKEIIDPDEIERLEDLEKQLKDAKNAMQDFQQVARETRYALQNLAPATFMQNFKKISSSIAHVGSALQSAGNALTRFSMPFRSLMQGAVLGTGYRMLGKVSEGLTSGFSRWDTMNKYTRLMKEYETANYTAEQSRKDLDESVQGLPIALDDAISLAQRYTLSLGDMERGTKLAIATNNAFLASMATEQQQYQGMLQMQDLLNGKKLTSREWMSLGASMGKAINEIGKEFGYTNENMGEFRQQLYAGKISTKDFLDALEKVGTGEGSLVKLAEESKNTWQAFSSRIGTAFSRMGYGVLQSLDEVVSTMTKGKFKTLNSWLDDFVISGIDGMTASVKDWIKSNPDKITGFFDALASVNWRGLVEGIAQGALALADIATSVGKVFGGNGMKLFGKAMVYSGIIGRGLTFLGGMMKGTRHLWGTLFAGAKELSKGGGIGGLLKSIMIGTGSASKGKESIETVATVAPKMGRTLTGLSKFFIGWAEVATMIGGSAFVAWGSMKLIKGALKSVKEIGDIVADIDWGNAITGIESAGVFITALIGVGHLIGSNPALMKDIGIGTLFTGALTLFGSGVFWADMALIKKGFKAIADSTRYLNDAIDNLGKIEAIGNVGVVKKRVSDAITTFNQIIGLFRGEEGADAKTLKMNGGVAPNKLQNLSKGVVTSLKNLASSLDSMMDSIDALNKIGGSKINVKGVRDIVPQLESALSSLGGMLERLPSIIGEEQTATNVGYMKNIVLDLSSTFDSLIGEGGILAQIQPMVQRISSLERSGSIEKLGEKLKNLGENIKNAFTAFSFGAGSGYGGGMPSLKLPDLGVMREGLKQIRLMIHHFNELGKAEVSDGAVANVKSIVSKIKDVFGMQEMNGIREGIEAFKNTIKDALEGIKEIGGDIEIDAKVKMSSGFDSSVNKTVKKIKDARKKINDAWSLIPTSLTKTISLTLKARVNTSGVIRGINEAKSTAETAWGNVRGGGATPSGGGLIYRAGGGKVFKPRGTDTIPAMLTAGEYVHNRHAVNAFGVEFMNRVNNLDVRGAMQALLAKQNSVASIGRQSVVNNTVNNNQRVTQNINTSNPHFASMSLGRFAGAL